MHFYQFTLLLILTAALLPGSAASTASIPDELVCPAELLILKADSLRYANATTSPLNKEGLERKMRTALATLPELCRRYQQTRSKVKAGNVSMDKSFIHKIRAIQQDSSDQAFVNLHQRVEPLTSIAPFSISRFGAFTEKTVLESGETYQTYCASCHQNSSSDHKNPAYSLHDMARNQTEPEFLARMLLGVKGTPEIGLSNPLSPSEIGAMRVYLLNSK